MEPAEESNFSLFRDILSSPLIARSTPSPAKTRKVRGKKTGRNVTETKEPVSTSATIRSKPTDIESQNDAAELGEFIDYIAHEIFISLPASLRSLTYTKWLHSPTLQAQYTEPLDKQTASSILAPLPPAIAETLHTYSILTPLQTLPEFLTPILSAYIATLTTAPPAPSSTKDLATECEICAREHIPLTYHHLIPRAVHAKVLKRGWHTEDQLNNVAWLCRACHSFVHSCASNEELAREWYSVERLVEREDVQRFAKWVGGVRWKKR